MRVYNCVVIFLGGILIEIYFFDLVVFDLI